MRDLTNKKIVSYKTRVEMSPTRHPTDEKSFTSKQVVEHIFSQALKKLTGIGPVCGMRCCKKRATEASKKTSNSLIHPSQVKRSTSGKHRFQNHLN